MGREWSLTSLCRRGVWTSEKKGGEQKPIGNTQDLYLGSHTN